MLYDQKHKLIIFKKLVLQIIQKIIFGVTNQGYNHTNFYNNIFFLKCIIILNHVENKQKVQLPTIFTVLLAFIVAQVITFIRSLSLYVALSCSLVSLYFTLQDSFEHFLQGRSSGHNSPNFCLLGNVLTSPPLLEASLAGYRIIG